MCIRPVEDKKNYKLNKKSPKYVFSNSRQSLPTSHIQVKLKYINDWVTINKYILISWNVKLKNIALY